MNPVPAEIDLEAVLKRLNLANTRRVYRSLIRRAESEQWSYGDFLSVLVSEEVAHRYQTRIQRLTRRARFPFLKTVEEFDFTFQVHGATGLAGLRPLSRLRHRGPLVGLHR